MKRNNSFELVCELFNHIDVINEHLCNQLLKEELIKAADIYKFDIINPAEYWKNVLYLTSLYKIDINAALFTAFDWVLDDCTIEADEYSSDIED